MKAVSVSLLMFALSVWAQSKPATVLDGVYTEQQAATGHEKYEAICAACHEGDEPEASPPKGSEFIERWRDAPLSFLHNFIHTSMPGDHPGTLSDVDYLNLVSYLLQANGYPTGSTELTASKTKDILLVGPDGPKPLPANALVSAVGCLVKSGDDWSLTLGSNPLRVRVGDETSPEELTASKTAPLGSLSYGLGNADDFPVAKLTGHKVQAKGVLTKVSAPMRISVQSLESVGESCAK